VDQTGFPKSLEVPNLDLFGDQIVLDPSGGPQGGRPRPKVQDQPVALATTAAAFTRLGIENGTDVSATIADVEGGRLVSWSEGKVRITIGTATVVDRGNRGQIAWGRFTNGTLAGHGISAGIVLTGNDSYHYVVAKETPLSAFPKTGSLEYKLVGSTTPTTTNATAQLLSAGLLANFTTSKVHANVSLLGPDTKGVAFSSDGDISGATFIGAGAGTGSGCASSCTSSFAGMFAGPQMQYAGFTYNITGTTFGGVRGAVALRR
jgi:hypothetical protein